MAAPPELPPRATLRLEHVLCGKRHCRKLHGPYWYAYWQGTTSRGVVGTRKAYLGKELPPAVARRRMVERERNLRIRVRGGAAHDDLVVRELELVD